jgi:Arsenical resistance operon protein ArsD
MRKLQVFDPPMCCPTGVCGPEVDPALVRFAADLEWLKSNGVEVERFNLAKEPAAFVGNPVVAQAIRGKEDGLPLLLVDGKIVAQGSYPAREVLGELVGVAGPARAVVELAEKYLDTKIATKDGPDACRPAAESTPVAIGGAAPTKKKCC